MATLSSKIEPTPPRPAVVTVASLPMIWAATMVNALQDTDILINTTSVGMHPQDQQNPIANRLIQSHLVVCDIVYNPPLTSLLKMAQEKGCRIVRGIGMLLYQGAASFQLWTGRAAPVDIMRRAIRP